MENLNNLIWTDENDELFNVLPQGGGYITMFCSNPNPRPTPYTTMDSCEDEKKGCPAFCYPGSRWES